MAIPTFCLPRLAPLLGVGLLLAACTHAAESLAPNVALVPSDAPPRTSPSYVSVRFSNPRGDDGERVLATDLGPAPGEVSTPGARLVAIESVPILWRKPTYRDVIVAVPDPAGALTWSGDAIEPRLARDGGLRRVVVRWTPRDAETERAAVASFLSVAAALGGGAEPILVPTTDKPGLVSFAVPYAIKGDQLIAALQQRTDAKVALLVKGQ